LAYFVTLIKIYYQFPINFSAREFNNTKYRC